jgi:hypothetical protein
MRSSMAYFAGAGTVIAAIAAGLGGGYLFFSIVSPHPEKHGSSEVTRLERRMSPEPIQAMTGSSQPVPYLAESQVSAAVAEAQAQAPQAQTPAPPPQQQAPAQPAAAPSPAPSPPAAQPVAAAEQKAAPEDSFAKARDGDLKRDARRAEERERRKAERRQQWTEREQWGERRKWRQRDDDDGELREVERRVREDSESRPLFASEPARMGMPRIRLFGNDD